jgi:hypothetical protein
LFEYVHSPWRDHMLRISMLSISDPTRPLVLRYGFAKPRWFSGGTYARIPESRRDWWVRREVGMYYGIVDKDVAGD